MGIYRGPGGSGDATNDASSEITLAVLARDAAQAAQAAAEAAQAAAELAETNAETAETNAETAETNAETAATAAQLAETNAETAQAAAEAAQAAAETAQTAAELAETNAETAETNAETAASLAQDWAIKVSGPVSGSDYSAKYNANLAAASASAAQTAETNAETAQAAAEAARDAALSAYDNFDDRYLGPKSSDPTLDNDGNALVAGALYFNTTSNVMKVYTGSAWVAAYVSAAGVLLAANNLSDLTNTATARTNLGVAIGTDVQAYDADTAKLDVSQSWSAAQSFNAGVTLGDASGDALTINSSAVSIPNGLNFDSNTLVIDATNNRVGVGTASPSKKITVDVADGDGIDIVQSGSSRLNLSTSLATLTSTIEATNYYLNIESAGTARGEILFSTSASSSTGSERMRITSTGNVGIGTSSPSFLSGYGGLQINGISTNSAVLKLTNSTTGTTSTDGFDILIGAASSDAYVWQRESAPLIFGTAATERMRLDNSGNLGLGVTPSAWASTYKAMQLGVSGLVYGRTGNELVVLGSNFYNDGSEKYALATSNTATKYQQSSGNHLWYTAPSGTAGNAITFTQAMTLNASGNLGIGTTSPSAKLDVAGDSQFGTSSTNGARTRYFNQNSQLFVGIDNNAGSNTGIANAPYFLGIGAYPMTFWTNTTERMRIDSSGRLFLGASSGVGQERMLIATDSSGTYSQGLNIKDTYASANANNFIVFRKSDDTYLGHIKRSTTSDAIYIGGNSFLALGSGDTERMRIDSSGNLLVNTTTANNPSLSHGFVTVNATGTKNAMVARLNQSGYTVLAAEPIGHDSWFFGYMLNDSGAAIGSISCNSTSTSYVTSSDYRLKENIAPMTGALAKVQSLKPVTYTWKSTGEASQGFIAHELQEVVPDCVTGEKDAVDAEGKPVYQGIDTSFLVATLTAAIQEQQAIITDLKARIETLESK